MCVDRFAIRYNSSNDVQSAGKRFVFAPCGHCEDCMNHSRYAWAWRLTSDLQYYVQNKGYKVGFITLTYNPSHLPHFPSKSDLDYLVRREFEYGARVNSSVYRKISDFVARFPQLDGVSCFSKKDTEDLILYIRKVGFRKYKLTDIVYFLSSELGDHTKREHYHLLLAWNGSKCSCEQMHELVRHYWCDYKNNGFVTPNTPQGGESKRSGKVILPFEVSTLDSCLRSAFYAAKYVTKDTSFMEKVLRYVDYKDLKYLKDYLPHHRQKKSLGFSSISSLSDDEKISLLVRGRGFLGNDKMAMPPMYIRDKLLFKPCYILSRAGKRLVTRECTDFFKSNFDLIIKQKLDYYDTLFQRMESNDFWLSSGLDSSRALEVSLFVKDNNNDLFGCSKSEAYVFYYGKKYNYCFLDKKLTYLNSYSHPAKVYSSILIPRQNYNAIQEFFGYLMSFTRWQNESVADKSAELTRDFFNQSA